MTCAVIFNCLIFGSNNVEIDEITLDLAGASVVAGFLCRYAKDRSKCPRGADRLISKTNDSELTEFLRRQDYGGLTYPCDPLIYLVHAVAKLFQEFWPTISQFRNMASTFLEGIIGPIRESAIITCGCDDRQHSLKLQDVLVKHLVKILLQNKSQDISQSYDIPVCKNKPASRKVLKLS